MAQRTPDDAITVVHIAAVNVPKDFALKKVSDSVSLPTPTRALLDDDSVEVLRFAIDAYKTGGGVALATLIEIRGGGSRALGSQVVVAADGRFGGYVSGGCVEAAVAAEALLAMAAGCDRTVMFGDGSPFFDIVLPCGGGITVAIHLLREKGSIEQVVESLRQRRPAGLRYSFKDQLLTAVEPPERTCWQGDDFLTVYRPSTRVVISGQTVEVQTVARIATASGYHVVIRDPAEGAIGFGRKIDAYTAVVLLHHDLYQEESILDIALKSSAFYIGALGSSRTHRGRLDRLKAYGYGEDDFRRIKAPIGVFGPTRDSASLALSILADVAATRLMVHA